MIVSSRKNPAVVRYRKLAADRRYRRDEGLFCVEGVRLCIEAVRSGIGIADAFVTETAAEKYHDAYRELCGACEPAVITDDIGSYISDTKTPQGMFITAKMLDNGEKMSKIKCGRLLLLDNVQDAGNLGTMIRTCDAFGMDGIVLSPDCADIYSPKVVRSAMGSLFRLPFAVTPLPCFIAGLQAEGCTVYAAVLDENAESIDDVQFPQQCAVVIGNEGNGISPDVITDAGHSIYIPIENAESLNAAVAAAIFCYRMKR